MRLHILLPALLAILAACTAPVDITSGFDGATPPEMRALIEVTR